LRTISWRFHSGKDFDGTSDAILSAVLRVLLATGPLARTGPRQAGAQVPARTSVPGSRDGDRIPAPRLAYTGSLSPACGSTTILAPALRVLADRGRFAIADRGRDVGDLVAARFALLGRPAQKSERLVEERLDIVRLEAAGLGALHLFSDSPDPAGVHGVVGERPFFKQVPQPPAVEREIEHHLQAGPHFGLIAVPDRLDEQLAQGSPLELKLAEHVENLAAERLARLLELVQ